MARWFTGRIARIERQRPLARLLRQIIARAKARLGMRKYVLAAVAACLGLLMLPVAADSAGAEKRVALVIGNSAYQHVAKLPNPGKDAAAIADMFRKAGFDWVKMRQDVGNLEFKRALREFMDAATDADIA